jgi:outer membrane usher protein
VNFSRNFNLDPYFVPFPSPTFSGTLTTPSTVDVYTNGLLVRRLTLPPGQFHLQDIPLASGAGNTQVVVQNAFGQQQVFNQPYYLATQVLAKGVQDYSYNLGLLRSNLGSASWQYGSPAFAATHLLGVTDALTAGAFLEVDRHLVTGGPELNLRLPFGETSVSGAASSNQGGGWSAAFAYSYLSEAINFGGEAILASKHYGTLNLTRTDDRALVQADVFTGLQLGPRITISPSFTHSQFRNRGQLNQARLLTSFRISDRENVQLAFTHSQQQGSPSSTDVVVALTILLGHSTALTASYEHASSNGEVATLQAQKSLPVGTGFGYLVQGQLGAQGQQIGDFQYQGPYGRYELDYQHGSGSDSENLNISGGLVLIGGHLLPTRAVQDSYALIRVPGLEAVTGYASNQPIGQTDDDGDLLVPNLLSYYGNQLSINDQQIPLNYQIDTTKMTVATPYRGGALVVFPVRQLRALTGKIRIQRGKTLIVPAFGELHIDGQGQHYSSPIGRQGEFYFENIVPGEYLSVIKYAGGDCDSVLQVPSYTDHVTSLGVVTCVAS